MSTLLWFVSFVNSLTYAISGYLARILSLVVGNTDYTVKNSCELADFIKDKTLNACKELLSFDVVSLFTKIPVDLAVNKVAEKRLRRCFPRTKNFLACGGYYSSAVFLPQNHVICIQRHLLSTSFWYSHSREFLSQQKKYFKYCGIQKIACGGYYSSAVFLPQNHVICIQRHLLSTSFWYSHGFARLCCHCQHSNFTSLVKAFFWKRYVDDVISAVSGNEAERLLSHLNSVEPSIQFTLEREKDRHFPFLDLNVSRGVQGNLETSVYRKSTHTNKYLAFNSHHPVCRKKTVAKTLLKRVEYLPSSLDSKAEEKKHVSNVLKANGYTKTCLRNCHKLVTTSSTPDERERFSFFFCKKENSALSGNTCLTNHTIGWDESKIITTNRRYHQRLCSEAWHITSAHAFWFSIYFYIYQKPAMDILSSVEQSENLCSHAVHVLTS